MKTVRFLPRARVQLRDIYGYIALDNEIAARAVVARVEETIGIIANNPGLGRVVSRRGVRRFPILPYPYLVYYRGSRTVQILCIMHSARRQPRFHELASPFAG